MRVYSLIARLMQEADQANVGIFNQAGEAEEPILQSSSEASYNLVLAPASERNKHKDSLTMDGYQQRAVHHAVYPEHGTGSVLAITAAISGMAGESGAAFHDFLKVMRGEAPLTPEMRDRLGEAISDVLWYCAALAKELDLTLSTAGHISLSKARSRQRAVSLEADQAALPARSGRMAAAGDA